MTRTGRASPHEQLDSPPLQRYARVGRPRGAKAGDWEERLLNVALDFFLDLGLTATIDAIAREASVSKRTIYARYSGKKELFVAATNRLLNARRRESSAFDASLPLDKLLYRMARLTFELAFLPEFQKLLRLAYRAEQDFPELLIPLDPTRDYIDPLATHLDMLIARGEIVAINTKIAAEFFIGSLFHHVNAYFLKRLPKPPEEAIDEWAQALTDICTRGLCWTGKQATKAVARRDRRG